MTTIPDFLPNPTGVDGYEIPYAGLVTRGLAMAIDAALVNLSLAALTAVVAAVLRELFPEAAGDLSLGTTALTAAAWIAIGSVYLLFFWTLVGQTPGMRVMSLRVATTAGSRMSIGRSLKRLIGLVPAFVLLPIGALVVLLSDRRQGLQDKLADSIMVYEPERARLGIGPQDG